VKTKTGVVTLKGKLPSQDAVDLVKMIAQKVKGVQRVDASGLVIGTT
jgi:hyperosmotically inducible protein